MVFFLCISKIRTAEGLERALRKQSGGLFLARSVYGSFPKNVNPLDEMKCIRDGRYSAPAKNKDHSQKRVVFFLCISKIRTAEGLERALRKQSGGSFVKKKVQAAGEMKLYKK